MNGKGKSKMVLLVLLTSGTPERAISFAVQRAKKENSRLVALYLLETELAKEAFDRFSDMGFTGDKPSSRLSESLMKEYRQRGYEELGRVQIKAMEEGVGFEPLTEEGSYVSTVLDLIERFDIGTAVLVKRRERAFLKYFSRSLSADVKKNAPCEVVIFTEE